jgi:hypothetical protein
MSGGNGGEESVQSGWRLALLAAFGVLCADGAAALGAEHLAETTPGQRACDVLDVRADERPRKEGEATKITLGVQVVDVTNIDDVNQSINVDFIVRQTWTDSRMIPFEGCKFTLEKVWTPHIDIVNSGHLWTRLRDYVEVFQFGRVQYMQRYHGAVVFPYQAHRFPFDKHEISLSFLSLEYGRPEVVLVNDDKFTGRTPNDFNVADWSIGTVLAFVQTTYLDAAERDHSQLNITLTAQRRTSYFFWKVMVPLTLIVAMSWMLTLIAFLFATQAIVPRLNYLTIMDKFVLGSTILVFLALVEAVMTAYFIAKEREALAVRMDRYCRAIFPAAFAVMILLLYADLQLHEVQPT